MSTLRVTGLASGIDYESMIKQIMDAQRVPLDKLNQKKQINQWKQDDYRAINNKVLDFKNAAFDMKLQSAYLTKTASSSNTNVATVTGTATAIEGSYSLQVEQLAKSATLKSGTLTGATIGKDTTISVNGVDVEVKSEDTYQDLANKINAQSVKTGVKVAYDSTLKTMFFSSSKTGAAADIDLRGADVGSILGLTTSTTAATTTGTEKLASDTSLASFAGKAFSLKIGGKEYKVDLTDKSTVGDLVSKMNDSLKNTGVSLSLNSTGNLVIDNPDKSKTIDFTTGSDAGVVGALGLTGATPTDTAPSIYTQGQNAKVKFNGVEGEYDSNTFTIAGLSITAKSEGSDVTNIGVTQDVDSVFNKIKTFVDKYNDLISSINSELSEEKYRDYTPLTDAQKKEMTDDQIKQWEEKAKSGMLANDSVLTSSLYSMRQALSSSISGLASGQLKNLSDIGISSSLISGTSVSGSYLDKGKLYIDETKLKQMISEKPDEVMALFTADDKDSKTTAGDGVATRLYNQASSIFSQIVDKAGTSTSVKNTYILGKESLEYDKQISALQTRLDDMETRYYNQFTQMETYISQMNSRSSSLASLLGS
ncbi:flagellar filament capping protein FliD [Paenibacillus sp. JDR-2]|uniref:flagellar filament capping protein FliD n=1 Tax=Paenibacillus sp. (strain JDR-2) TaxID=324057 RepID=UPI0001667CF2|nr:flagellar filament capping protein FliD [Paenibacillus sp. JDR-2]ACT04357.1 flagellar hook-associated 2 domain protein [Paenibacillus sp. JDR-2]